MSRAPRQGVRPGDWSMYAQALSTEQDTRAAATAAAREAMAALGGTRPTAVLVFSTDGHDGRTVLDAVRAVTGDAPLAGANAPAVLAAGRVSRHGVAVMVSDTLRMVPASSEGASRDGAAAAEAAVSGAVDGMERAGGAASLVVMMPDGIRGNSVEAARGAVRAVGGTVRVAGGGAGDDMKFARTHQYRGDAVLEDACLAVALAAGGPVGFALRHGCVPTGAPMVATDVTGRRLARLDYRPAFERYAEVAAPGGLSAADFMAFAMLHPLGLVQGSGADHVLRSPLSVEDGGAMGCCSDTPPSAVLRVMEGTPAGMLDAAREAAAAARAELGSAAPGAALVFACVSRDFVLGADAAGRSLELDAVARGVGADVPVFGCLTFGGFGTLGSGLPQYHSKSVGVAVLPAA